MYKSKLQDSILGRVTSFFINIHEKVLLHLSSKIELQIALFVCVTHMFWIWMCFHLPLFGPKTVGLG